MQSTVPFVICKYSTSLAGGGGAIPEGRVMDDTLNVLWPRLYHSCTPTYPQNVTMWKDEISTEMIRYAVRLYGTRYVSAVSPPPRSRCMVRV